MNEGIVYRYCSDCLNLFRVQSSSSAL